LVRPFALAAFRASFPAGHPSTAEALVPLAELRLKQGRCAEAQAFAREAVATLSGKLRETDRRSNARRGRSPRQADAAVSPATFHAPMLPVATDPKRPPV
jgi:hypothetical protein